MRLEFLENHGTVSVTYLQGDVSFMVLRPTFEKANITLRSEITDMPNLPAYWAYILCDVR